MLGIRPGMIAFVITTKTKVSWAKVQILADSRF